MTETVNFKISIGLAVWSCLTALALGSLLSDAPMVAVLLMVATLLYGGFATWAVPRAIGRSAGPPSAAAGTAGDPAGSGNGGISRAASEADESGAVLERNAQKTALTNMVETIECEVRDSLTEVSSRTSQMIRTAYIMSESAQRTGDAAGEAANATARVMEAANTVASAADELSASIRESKYPPAKPGALEYWPLKAASQVADATCEV